MSIAVLLSVVTGMVHRCFGRARRRLQRVSVLVEPDANLQMGPVLATSWEVSPDQLTWTFRLCLTPQTTEFTAPEGAEWN